MTAEYNPPKVWIWEKDENAPFALNRPTAGATSQKDLPVGKHPLQLYSLATPNGVKATIMLEELLAAGHKGAEYNAHLINILEGDQFTSGFVEINPNSKIPALVDRSVQPNINVFESGSILLYLAEKFKAFIPDKPSDRTECLNWMFWQMGAAPILGGGFGHFYAYAPTKQKYPIDRYTMEVKRQLDVLDQHLAGNRYMVGDQYTIADMMILPWYGALVTDQVYNAAEFIGASSYKNVLRWTHELFEREPIKRAQMVNRTWGPPEGQLHERHDASDFQNKTQDKTS